jgi:hypothetical protein
MVGTSYKGGSSIWRTKEQDVVVVPSAGVQQQQNGFTNNSSSSGSNSVTQQHQQKQQHVSRDMHWTMTAVGTTLSLIALFSVFIESESLHEQSSRHKWGASAIIIALILSWIALFFTIIIRTKFVGSLAEGIMVRL